MLFMKCHIFYLLTLDFNNPLQLWILIQLAHSQCAMNHLNISRKEDLEGIHLPVERLLILVLLCITQLSGIKFMYLQPRLVVFMSEGYNLSLSVGRTFVEFSF